MLFIKDLRRNKLKHSLLLQYFFSKKAKVIFRKWWKSEFWFPESVNNFSKQSLYECQFLLYLKIIKSTGLLFTLNCSLLKACAKECTELQGFTDAGACFHLIFLGNCIFECVSYKHILYIKCRQLFYFHKDSSSPSYQYCLRVYLFRVIQQNLNINVSLGSILTLILLDLQEIIKDCWTGYIVLFDIWRIENPERLICKRLFCSTECKFEK